MRPGNAALWGRLVLQVGAFSQPRNTTVFSVQQLIIGQQGQLFLELQLLVGLGHFSLAYQAIGHRW
ncbi:hypothetical protein CI374_14440 [Salmonella enterica subsp. enterica serovar Panama]|nr:hypothetical protein [Salmonella enterica subsp. enterica serovar Panama]